MSCLYDLVFKSATSSVFYCLVGEGTVFVRSCSLVSPFYTGFYATFGWGDTGCGWGELFLIGGGGGAFLPGILLGGLGTYW